MKLGKNEIFIGKCNDTSVVISAITKKSKVVGGGVWLTQGLEYEETNYWISEEEIIKHIELLQKAKDSIQYLYKRCRSCYYYNISEWECDHFEDWDEVQPDDTCERFKPKGDSLIVGPIK